MDGIELCKTVRNMQLDGYVYVLLLTARDAKEHIVAGLEAGADDYLIKPMYEPELLARLNTAPAHPRARALTAGRERAKSRAVDHRCAHRHVQPALPHGAAAARARPLPPLCLPLVGDHVRHRPLQGRQRRVWARGRRRSAAPICAAHPKEHPRLERLGRSLRRRGVHDHAARHRAATADSTSPRRSAA